MGRSIVRAVMIVLLMGLAGSMAARAAEPGLVGYWKFEGDTLDSSGNDRTGTLVGNAGFAPGLDGQALTLDGSGDYMRVDSYLGILGGNPFTIATWVNSTTTVDDTMVNWGSSTNGQRVDFRLYQGRLRVEHGNGNLQGNTPLNDGEWHHVACVVGPNASIQAPDVTLYLDGKDDTQATTDADKFDIVGTVPVTIGQRRTNNDRAFFGLLDEVRIYDRVLTAAEIKALSVRPKAYGPSPADGMIGATSPLLSWQPRQTSLFHDVYLGTDPNLGSADLVSSHQPVTVYWHGPGLEPGATYYWRIDEIDPDGAVHQGDVWTFIYATNEAFLPSPTDGAPYVDPDLTLSWVAGLSGVTHDVYFGADEAAVAAGTDDTFKGNQVLKTYTPGPLAPDTKYFWRVDELDNAGGKVPGHVWSFSTLPVISVSDPNMVCWWKIDEGAGSRVVDWSGHGNHGAFEGDPIWVPGYDGGALEFDGIDDSVVASLGAATTWPAFTVSLWTRPAFLGQAQYKSPFSNHNPNSAGFQIDVDGGNPGSYRVNPSGLIFGPVSMEWVHLAVTATGTAAKLYYNGEWTAGGTLTDSVFNQIAIAKNRNVDNRFAGAIDEVRVFNRELTQEELDLVIRIDPLRAWRPSPGDGVIVDIRAAAPLTWTEGDNASQHEVYLGVDAAAVAAADATDATGLYRGRRSSTSYTPAEDLQWGMKYFWRVDEINADGSLTAGKVWSFTVSDYLIVDDFESYNDLEGMDTRIYETWIDGYADGSSGSTVGNLVSPFAERTIVYAGSQAMPLDYNNVNPPHYSEAERTWEKVQNWTFGDVNTLVVHFRGEGPAFLQTAADAMALTAAGTDIWNTADECRYVYKQLNGDGSIIARVDSIMNTHVWAKGGVMIRETLDPGSRHGSVFVTPGSGTAFQRRLIDGDVSVGTTLGGPVAPHWVKLTRTGDTLTAQHSADGITWEDVGASTTTLDTVAMGSSVYIGVVLTSHAAGVACTAEFSGITTTGNVSGAWQMAEIGVSHPGNSTEDLYVTVEDSTGKKATATHPDPAATILTDWQTWSIDLASLTGVKTSAVKRMYIGVGDRNSPVPGGAGRVYIDDIRITKGVPVEPNAVP